MSMWISFFDDNCCRGAIKGVAVSGNSFSIDFVDVDGNLDTLKVVKSGNSYSGSYSSGSIDWISVYQSIDGWLVRCKYISDDGEEGVWELFVNRGLLGDDVVLP